MPNCFSISISPVVALNAALDNVVKSLLKAAATLPKSVKTPDVGVIPAFSKVMNEVVTSSSWKVVPAVNFLTKSIEIPAPSALPVTALRVALRSSNFRIVFTVSPANLPIPTAASTVPSLLKESIDVLTDLSTRPTCLFIWSRPLRSCCVSARMTTISSSTVIAISLGKAP